MAIDLGDLVRLEFTNLVPVGGGASTPANPDTVTVTVTLPDGTTSGPTTVSPTSLGKFQYDYTTTMPGRHLVRWLGIGANPGAHTDAFDVLLAQPAYIISIADAKEHLQMAPGSTGSDEELRDFIGAATKAIERHLDECIVRRTITEEKYLPDYIYGEGQGYYPGQATLTTPRRVSLAKTPAQQLISVARVDGTFTWDVSTMHLSTAGIIDTQFGTPLFGHITVTYIAGYQVIEEDTRLAAKIIVQHLWETQRGARGGPRAGGQDLGMTRAGFALPNRALELLGGGMPGFA